MEELNPIALQYLYGETLYHFSEQNFLRFNKDFLGNNSNKLILISKASLNEEDIKLLTKILAALQIKLEDCALICNKQEAEYTSLLNQLEPIKIILFGISPFEVGYKECVANTYEIANIKKVTLLQAEKFDLYHTNTDKKKALWLTLQKFFQ